MYGCALISAIAVPVPELELFRLCNLWDSACGLRVIRIPRHRCKPLISNDSDYLGRLTFQHKPGKFWQVTFLEQLTPRLEIG